MKTVILGDIHGTNYWQTIINFEKPDRVVFVGDYFDSFNIPPQKEIENFKDILEYKKSGLAEVILLVGNHDHHYLKSVGPSGTSGYKFEIAFQAGELLEQADLKMAYQFKNILVTHAGLSHVFMRKHFPNYDVESVADNLNELFHHKPLVFQFNTQALDPYGDDIYQSPIWIRPRSLMRANRNTELKETYIQVFGHTQVEKVDTAGHRTGGRYYCIDSLSTSGEYMYIEDDSNSIVFNSHKKYKL